MNQNLILINKLRRILKNKQLDCRLKVELLREHNLYFKDIETIRTYLENPNSLPIWTKYDPKIHTHFKKEQVITALYYADFESNFIAVKAKVIEILPNWWVLDGCLCDAVLLECSNTKLKPQQFILTHFLP